MHLRLALALFISMIASPGLAQERLACFEPGTTILTPAGYTAAREAAHSALEAGVGRDAANAVEIVTSEPDTSRYWTPRTREIWIELQRAGLAVGRARTVFEAGSGEPDCVRLRPLANYSTIVEDEYLLYFEPDSDVVRPDWTATGARLLVVKYRPGERFVVIDAHAEEVESDPEGLSRRRAENIARDLVRAGVRWEDIVIRAHGSRGGMARPVARGVSEPLNRRAIVAVRRHRPASFG